MAAPARAVPASAGNWVIRFYGSTIGRKIVMALTGIVLVGFITVHMTGNLLAYRGAESLDEYAAFLKSKPPLLWGTRIVVFLALVLHTHAAITLTRRARRARPDRYARLEPQASTWSSRLMRMGGLLLAGFVVFHILHFTTGTVLPSEFVEGAVYQNVVRSFSIAWVAGFYLVAMAALALHLHHGVWSLFQTLGLARARSNRSLKALSIASAVVIFCGNISFPIAVLMGVLK
jgi:succinate dehydrogenase / fumarate reductase cytochrome b subunit